MAYIWPILLLLVSNLFMTVAWYGHLKFKEQPLPLMVLVSWGIAFFEYTFMVPANRIGEKVYTVTQLKIIQEAITLTVFIGFAWLVFKEVPNWRTGLALLLVFVAVAIVPKKSASAPAETQTVETKNPGVEPPGP